MPRVYKPDPRVKRRHKVSNELISAAISDIKIGLSYRDCAIKHGIDHSVLYRHSKKMENNEKKRHAGGSTILSADVEEMIVDRLAQCAEWGYPLDLYDLRVIVKNYLDRAGRVVKIFRYNFPGKDFARSFMQRHKSKLSLRLCQNIKRNRAGVSREELTKYFSHLQKSVQGVDPKNIVNYDETNLTDDPGRKSVISKRGMKYPERVMNNSKSTTSIMFAATGLVMFQ